MRFQAFPVVDKVGEQHISSSEYLAERISGKALDVRISILMLTVYSVSIFFVDTWPGMGVYALILAVWCAYLRTKGLSIGKMLKVGAAVYVVAAITIVCNIFMWNGEAVVASIEGLERGLFFAARMILLVLASLAVCLSADISRLEQALTSLLSPLRVLHVPVDDIVMVCLIAIRFIPVVSERFLDIRAAQWSRGAHFDDGSLLSRLRSYSSIFAPLLIGLFWSADRLSVAMDARCYGIGGEGRTNLHAGPVSPGQVLAVALGSALCIATCLML